FQAEDGIRDFHVTGVQTCALPIFADNAAGHFMRAGQVNIVLVGSDRTAANGDLANKIGTYQLGVLAKENGVPFYPVVPTSTVDRSEERRVGKEWSARVDGSGGRRT